MRCRRTSCDSPKSAPIPRSSSLLRRKNCDHCELCFAQNACSVLSSLQSLESKKRKRDSALPWPCLDFQIIRPHNHDEVIRLNELRKTVSLDENSRRVNASERFPDSRFDLLVSCNDPVNISSSGIPVAPGIFPQRVSQLASRSNHSFVFKQIAHATSVWIFSAGTIVSPRSLDRFPSRKRAKQSHSNVVLPTSEVNPPMPTIKGRCDLF